MKIDELQLERVKTSSLVIMIALLASGCGLNLSAPNPATPTPFIITASLPASAPPPPTETLPPPTPPSTAAPVEGRTSTQLNVRGQPSTASTPLGMIPPFTKVQILGKDPGGNWYQIVYAGGADGKGWVTAQYVEVKDKGAIPILGGAAGSGSGPSGVVTQQINVRSGPGTDFDALGTLNPNDVVTLTGKDAKGVWLQILFTNAPDGKGWVTAAYVQATGVEALPILAQTGEVVGTGTPTGVPPTITPTLIAAPQDGDSAQSPAANVTFSPSGVRSLIFSSDVSSPDGDPEDWVQFTSYGPTLRASLICTGNGDLQVELWQDNASLQNWTGLGCNQTKLIGVSAGQPYLFHLLAVPAGGGLEYVHYTLSLETAP